MIDHSKRKGVQIKTNTFLLVSLFFTLVFSQKIAMTDVEFFYGAVLTSLDTLGNRTIVSKKFENYGIERTYSIRNDLKFLQSKIRIVRDSTLIVGGTYDMMTNDPEKHFRLIPYNNTLMILFHDLIGFESMFDLLSFWKNNKDSLEFIAFNQKCFTNPIGSTRFEDVYLKDARQSYIIFRSGGGDGGTSWGDLIVSQLIQPNQIKCLRKFQLGTINQKLIELKGNFENIQKLLFIKLSTRISEEYWNLTPKTLKDTIEFFKMSDLILTECVPKSN